MSRFQSHTTAVFIVPAIVVGIVRFYFPRKRIIRVPLICVGYLLGWFSAWLANDFYS